MSDDKTAELRALVERTETQLRRLEAQQAARSARGSRAGASDAKARQDAEARKATQAKAEADEVFAAAEEVARRLGNSGVCVGALVAAHYGADKMPKAVSLVDAARRMEAERKLGVKR